MYDIITIYEIYFMKTKNNIPYIICNWVSTPRSDKNIVRFRCVTAIIQNKDTKKYFALEFIKKEFWLVWWKIEKGETSKKAMIREVKEEAWYKNAKIKKVIFDKVYARGYKVRKKQEQELVDKVYFVEVEEKNKIKILWADFWTENQFWFTKKEMLEKLTITHHIYYFKEYLK